VSALSEANVTEELDQRAKQAREALDAHVREVVRWHFDPDGGTPFWLAFQEKLDFDPRKDIQCFEDLKRFPLFEDAWLRGGPVRRWVPKSLADKPIYVFETGGTTGIPKSRVAMNDFRTDYELFGDALPDEHSCSAPRGRAACAWRSSTSPSIGEVSASASTSIRAG
jgi:phenylacetate-coenzyme A ligase PaaK-like adenylate-forming protein